jgi:LysR family hydrogen peroxide-inducible transcriptional activator
MTLTQLSYIVAVADHHHFGAAANACFVTQPTLSMQLQKLEEELGVILFDRSKQPIRATAIGAQIIAQARIVLADAEKIKNISNETLDGVEGELRLAVIPTLAPYVLPLFLNSLSAKYPQLQIVIEELQTKQIVERLQARELDVGIAVTPLAQSTLVEDVLFQEPFELYLSPKHDLLKKKLIEERDLSASEVWLLGEGHCFRDQALSLCRAKGRPNRTLVAAGPGLRFESGNLETLKKMVDQGSGYTLLPLLAARDITDKEQKKRIREFAQPIPTREVSLVYDQHYSRKALVKALADEIRAAVPRELKNIAASDIKRVGMAHYS